nr:DNA oxidative demethylase ALKBH2-like [Procambarus clarkii]
MNRYVIKTKQLASSGEILGRKPSIENIPELKRGLEECLVQQPNDKNKRKLDDKAYTASCEFVKEGDEIEPNSTCMYKNVNLSFPSVGRQSLQWRKIVKNNLDIEYTLLLQSDVASSLLQVFEEELDYFTGDLAKVRIFGKWHDVPRKQATYGDPGTTYKYSGVVRPARPWPRPLEALRDLIGKVTGYEYNFVLVNRYKDGSDKMGEHKDDEKDLDPRIPIASVSLGQARDFYFRHQDARPPKKLNIEKVQLHLQHGSLLLMNPPTNQFWYHALPPRKSASGVRINLTFRKIIQK